jgi:hypothetical protein
MAAELQVLNLYHNFETVSCRKITVVNAANFGSIFICNKSVVLVQFNILKKLLFSRSK